MSKLPEANDELVVLLDDSGRPIGTCPKSLVHHENTPLHSAFSVFLFTEDGSMLIQRRALHKPTWPGVWSNACCGHPAPGESVMEAARRRLGQELGLHEVELEIALPRFRYRAQWGGLWENEICPVLVGLLDSASRPQVNPQEVESIAWVRWESFIQALNSESEGAYRAFSPWCKAEARLLDQSPVMKRLLAAVA